MCVAMAERVLLLAAVGLAAAFQPLPLGKDVPPSGLGKLGGRLARFLPLPRADRQATAVPTAPASHPAQIPAVLRRARQAPPEPASPSPPSVWLEGGSVRCRVGPTEYTLLGSASSVSLADDVPGLAGPPQLGTDGAFLALTGAAGRRDHVLPIGELRCRRLLALARTKRWWMGPSFGSAAADVPAETQMLLLELEEGAYALVLPLVHGGVRATLRGTRGRRGHHTLAAQLAAGGRTDRLDSMSPGLYVTAGRDPYALVRGAVGAAAERLGSFGVREGKAHNADLDHFGWCTWDAFYQHVDAEGVRTGVRSLAALGTPARKVIIDDGWQSVHDEMAEEGSEAEDVAAAAAGLAVPKDANAPLNDPAKGRSANPLLAVVASSYRRFVHHAPTGAATARTWALLSRSLLRKPLGAFFASSTPFNKRLSSFRANSKFEDPSSGTSLRQLVTELKANLGVASVYCWHTLGGYWGGVSTTSPSMAHLDPRTVMPKPARGLLEVEPALAWDPAALFGVGAIEPDRLIAFYEGLHGYLAAAGVDGVKVDGQSGLGPFGGAEWVAEYVRAMEESVTRHFGSDRCINCMCHSTENLFAYRSTSVIRAADDFYPAESASHPVHLRDVAFNSLLLGEIGTPDWDMFTSTHPDATLHAAARAVGGCSVYVSDKPGEHGGDLLRKLVLPDGGILRCSKPGRPTRSNLFCDPNSDGRSALTVFNQNTHTAVLAAFNVQGARWDRTRRRFVGDASSARAVTAVLGASDVDGWRHATSPTGVAAYAHQAQTVTRLAPPQAGGNAGSLSATLRAKEWEIFTLSPVMRHPVGTGMAEWAPFGLASMLNGGGAVHSSSLAQVRLSAGVQARVSLSASGDFVGYCRPQPREVRANGAVVGFNYDAEAGVLRVPLPRAAEQVRLAVDIGEMRGQQSEADGGGV